MYSADRKIFSSPSFFREDLLLAGKSEKQCFTRRRPLIYGHFQIEKLFEICTTVPDSNKDVRTFFGVIGNFVGVHFYTVYVELAAI